MKKSFEERQEQRTQEELRNRENVFGRQRLEETQGHEASKDDIQALTNAVNALFDITENIPDQLPLLSRKDIVGGDSEHNVDEGTDEDYIPSGRTPAERTRRLTRSGQPPITLYIDPEGLGAGFGSGYYDFFPASVEGFKWETRTVLRPRNGLRPGKYGVRESVYLDPERGIADLVRSYTPRSALGTWLSASKPATSEELSGVLDAITDAVRHNDEISENVR